MMLYRKLHQSVNNKNKQHMPKIILLSIPQLAWVSKTHGWSDHESQTVIATSHDRREFWWAYRER